MYNFIFHNPLDESICVGIPMEDLPVSEVAKKCVPFGVPFLIIENNELPSAETQSAWEANFSSPDGVGMGPQRWFIAQAETKLAELAAVEITDELDIDQHNAEVTRQNALIAQMKAEVLQIEGVAL